MTAQPTEPKPCAGFPADCPALVAVEPDPPHHGGGVRCGCAELTERDQYFAAARHLARRITEVACIWHRDLPETVRTADVVSVLLGIASHVPDRPELRDDLWMRIAGAYEARFENDGHPEDARAAADEAMSVVQPVLAAGERAQKRLEQARALHKETCPLAKGELKPNAFSCSMCDTLGVWQEA
ncbi:MULTISPECIES: hypothetical protein [unclassified Streptomyces]|uniref:hypothetical protein n=1 Tax=unclassified Streptomyces TaxID=2593676 RepID=UPI0036E882CA